MSVIVRGMGMPKNCAECRLWDTCKYMNDFDDWVSILDAVEDGDLIRDKNCPLIEIPTPHGRLVDIKSVEDRKFTTVDNEYERWWNGALDSVVDNAPTVIEAEGREE